jgi:formylglycine-generating enzyme required for sulfatase activity
MQMARQGGLPPMRRMQSTSGSAVPVKLIAGLFVFVVVIGVLIALLIGQPPVETGNHGNGSHSTTNVPPLTGPVFIGNPQVPVIGTTTQPETVNPDTLPDRLVLRLDALDIAKFFILPHPETLSGSAVGSPSDTSVATKTALDAAAIVLVRVKPGTFKMGVNDFPDDRLCAPIHDVEFTKPYFIGETEVTYAQFIAFVNSDSRHSRLYKEWLNSADAMPGPMTKDGDFWRLPIEAAYLPVTNITKTFADMYVNWLNEALAASLPNVEGWAVRLPSEEEWEFAARGSQSNKFPWGNDDATYIPAHLDTEGGLSGPVAVNDPRFKDDVSQWSGARGMGGNVCEWTSSVRRAYFSKKRVDPTPLTSGDMRIYRGGAYNMDLNFCRSAFRHGMTANVKKNNVGMRIYLGR